MATRVLAAFLASGGLNAGTPLAIASTPVSATDPPAKAWRSRKSPDGLGARAPGRTAERARLVGGAHERVGDADGDGQQGHEQEQVRGQGEDVARLADAAQVRRRHEDDRQGRQFDPVVADGRPRPKPGWRWPTRSRRRPS